MAETRRLRGVSLATKLAAIIALIIGVFMIGFGISLSRFIRQTVKDQVMVAAAASARAAAQADIDAWTAYFGTVDQGRTPAEVQERVNAMSPVDFRLYDRDEERKAAIEWNKERFARFLGERTRIVAAELRLYDGGVPSDRVAASSYVGQSMEFAPARGARVVRFGDGTAQEGFLTLDGVTRAVIRGASPLMSPEGEPEGEIAVYIDAGVVDAAVEETNLKVAYASMIFLLVGVGISYALGKRITRPMRYLQEDIRVVAGGDLDHHTRPRSGDEIGELAHAFDQMTKSLKAARDAEREAAASRHDMAVAAEVAARLRPSRLPEIAGYDCAGYQGGDEEPAGETYDVLEMPGGRWGLLVAQASGSGVAAAIVMAMTRSFLRVVAHGEADPGEVLRRVNAHLSGDLRQGMYVSVLLAVLDPKAGRLSVANAGAAPLMHVHAEGERVTAFHSEGIALGFDEGPVFDRTLKVVDVEVQPGDRLVLYAPTVKDLPGAGGEMLGEKRLAALVKRESQLAAESFIGRVTAALRRFAGRDELGADVTMLTLGRLPS